jgi:hypothetical protein
MKRSLTVRNPDGSTSEVELNKPVTKVGRAPDNDLVLIDDDRSVSGHLQPSPADRTAPFQFPI